MLKIFALEIYNEIVRDLLNLESGALRLLDDPKVANCRSLLKCFAFIVIIYALFLVLKVIDVDPEREIVERLVEETVKDNKHFRRIIVICEGKISA